MGEWTVCSIPTFSTMGTLRRVLAFLCSLLLVTRETNSQDYNYAAPAQDGHDIAASGSHKDDGYHHDPAIYSFRYDVEDTYTGNLFGQYEERDGDYTAGAYHVLLPDGRHQKVTYTVDGDSGFVAQVDFEGEAHGYQQALNHDAGGSQGISFHSHSFSASQDDSIHEQDFTSSQVTSLHEQPLTAAGDTGEVSAHTELEEHSSIGINLGETSGAGHGGRKEQIFTSDVSAGGYDESGGQIFTVDSSAGSIGVRGQLFTAGGFGGSGAQIFTTDASAGQTGGGAEISLGPAASGFGGEGLGFSEAVSAQVGSGGSALPSEISGAQIGSGGSSFSVGATSSQFGNSISASPGGGHAGSGGTFISVGPIDHDVGVGVSASGLTGNGEASLSGGSITNQVGSAGEGFSLGTEGTGFATASAFSSAESGVDFSVGSTSTQYGTERVGFTTGATGNQVGSGGVGLGQAPANFQIGKIPGFAAGLTSGHTGGEVPAADSFVAEPISLGGNVAHTVGPTSSFATNQIGESVDVTGQLGASQFGNSISTFISNPKAAALTVIPLGQIGTRYPDFTQGTQEDGAFASALTSIDSGIGGNLDSTEHPSGFIADFGSNSANIGITHSLSGGSDIGGASSGNVIGTDNSGGSNFLNGHDILVVGQPPSGVTPISGGSISGIHSAGGFSVHQNRDVNHFRVGHEGGPASEQVTGFGIAGQGGHNTGFGHSGGISAAHTTSGGFDLGSRQGSGFAVHQTGIGDGIGFGLKQGNGLATTHINTGSLDLDGHVANSFTGHQIREESGIGQSSLTTHGTISGQLGDIITGNFGSGPSSAFITGDENGFSSSLSRNTGGITSGDVNTFGIGHVGGTANGQVTVFGITALSGHNTGFEQVGANSAVHATSGGFDLGAHQASGFTTHQPASGLAVQQSGFRNEIGFGFEHGDGGQSSLTTQETISEQLGENFSSNFGGGPSFAIITGGGNEFNSIISKNTGGLSSSSSSGITHTNGFTPNFINTPQPFRSHTPFQKRVGSVSNIVSDLSHLNEENIHVNSDALVKHALHITSGKPGDFSNGQILIAPVNSDVQNGRSFQTGQNVLETDTGVRQINQINNVRKDINSASHVNEFSQSQAIHTPQHGKKGGSLGISGVQTGTHKSHRNLLTHLENTLIDTTVSLNPSHLQQGSVAQTVTAKQGPSVVPATLQGSKIDGPHADIIRRLVAGSIANIDVVPAKAVIAVANT